MVQCPAEADWEIACLAHQWNCPVLSYDSDFYIFDLPGGGSYRTFFFNKDQKVNPLMAHVMYYIYVLCFPILGGYLPFRFFQWNNLNGKASQRYIPAQRYTTSRLCCTFAVLDKELLSLCAVLAGNDYGIPKEAEKALALLDLGGSVRGGGRGKGRSPISPIEGILLWLSTFTCAGKAIEEMNELMGEEGSKGRRGLKSSLSSQLWAGIQEYQIKPPSSLARWFSEGKAAPGGQCPGFTQLPECLLLAAARGLLAPQVVDAFVLRRVLLVPQVENCKLASSHCSSRAIRQALYGIVVQPVKGPQDVQTQGINHRMRGGRGQGGRGVGGRVQGHISSSQQGVNTGFSMQHGACAATVQAQGMSTPTFVEEYDRVDLNYQKKQVEALPPRTTIHLDKLGQVNII